MGKLPYPERDGQTHWESCFREPKHHNCAVAEVDRLLTRLAEVEAENERLLDALREPFLAVHLDGRNEWGTHVLELPASSLGHFHEDTVHDMEKNEDDVAERIMSDAEALGHKAGHAVVTRWRVDGEGFEAYMEYRGISTALTAAMFGTAEEQEAEHARAALAQTKEPKDDG